MIATTDVTAFLGRHRGRRGPDWTDWLAYAYLAIGVAIVLLPVL